MAYIDLGVGWFLDITGAASGRCSVEDGIYQQGAHLYGPEAWGGGYGPYSRQTLANVHSYRSHGISQPAHVNPAASHAEGASENDHLMWPAVVLVTQHGRVTGLGSLHLASVESESEFLSLIGELTASRPRVALPLSIVNGFATRRRQYVFPDSPFSIAVEARALWAEMRIAITAGEVEHRVEHYRAKALAFAQEHAIRTYTGRVAGYCPFANVKELFDAWHIGFEKARRGHGHLDEEEMRALLGKMSESANSGCGLVYEIFEQRLSNAVDARVEGWSQESRDRFIELAKEYGYITPEEQAEADKSRREEGLCSHFLDAKTCPVGCFERDDGAPIEYPDSYYEEEESEDEEEVGEGGEEGSSTRV